MNRTRTLRCLRRVAGGPLLLLWVASVAAPAVQTGGFILSPDDPNRYLSHLPSPPTPRLPDGRPNFGRTESGKGAWLPRQIHDYARVLSEGQDAIPYQPWAAALKQYREHVNLSADDPQGFCIPPGGVRLMTTFFPMEMIQLPDRILFIFEGGGHVWRVVHMDGRPHPPAEELELFPTFLGHSIGHWEGDTLVVDTIGFNEGTWIDMYGDPHTRQMHLVERFTRPNLMTLHYEATIDDPGAYTRPWTIDWDIPWQPDRELDEYICQGNNRWQEGYIRDNDLASGTGNVGADMGHGHPLTGVWLGDWMSGSEHGANLVITLDWDGSRISGTINPGPDQVALDAASMNPDWTVHFEAESSDGTVYVIDGQIENLGWTTRSIAGSWTQGDTTGDFRITRQR